MLLPTIGDALRSHYNRATSALEARRMGTDDMATGQRFRVIDLLRHGTEPPPLAAVTGRPWWPWLVVAITCIGAFIGQLDASIVQLALPTLVDVFHDSLARVTWVALAYSLAFAASLPIFGRLCEIYGRKVLYLAGFFFFTIATALCGFAADLESLILFRILQGIAGSLLGANSISVLVATAGPTRRARAMGIFSAAQAVGLCLGPVIGGILVGTLGWRSIFLATVPFGAIAVVLGWLALPQTAHVSRQTTFDWIGALLLTPALVALVFALNHAAALGLGSPLILGCVISFVVLMALLIRWERSIAFPLVNLRLFSSAAFTAGAAGAALGYALLYGMFFLISFALVRGYHLAPSAAGLRLATIPVAVGVVAPLSGVFTDRWGPNRVRATGMAACFVALLLLSLLAPEERIGLTTGLSLLALYGAGIGLFIAPNNAATMSAAPDQFSGEAGAMLNLMRSLGTSIGIAAASSMLTWRMREVGLDPSGDFTFGGHPLLAAAESSFVMLMIFAAIAGGISFVRAPHPSQAS
jgi:EmrB/QacA subfamily drug resistance transporter